jgi:hypothetical protein
MATSSGPNACTPFGKLHKASAVSIHAAAAVDEHDVRQRATFWMNNNDLLRMNNRKTRRMGPSPPKNFGEEFNTLSAAH